MTENEIYKMDDRRLINFFEDSILQDPTLETTLNNLTALTALLDRGFISIFSPKIDIVFSQSKKQFIVFGRTPEEKFNENNFVELGSRFRDMVSTYEKVSDELKDGADLNFRTRIVDRDEIVHALTDKCYKSYISSRNDRISRQNSIKSIKNQFNNDQTF